MERREAQRPTSLGARGLTVPREVGPLIPPQRVPRKHSGASRRSIALATARGDTGKTSDALRRENAQVRLFEIVETQIRQIAAAYSLSSALLNPTEPVKNRVCRTNGAVMVVLDQNTENPE